MSGLFQDQSQNLEKNLAHCYKNPAQKAGGVQKTVIFFAAFLRLATMQLTGLTFITACLDLTVCISSERKTLQRIIQRFRFACLL